MKPRIRIEAPDLMGNHARVFHVAGDGTETEISEGLTGVELTVDVGEINRATLHMRTYVGVEGEAVIDDVLLEVIPPDRIDAVIERLRAQQARQQ